MNAYSRADTGPERSDSATSDTSESAGSAADAKPVPESDVDPVLVAARQVIMEHGPRRATLSEVARRAGVSRMTVYRRFDTWDRILHHLLTLELAELMVAAEERVGKTPTARQRAVTASVFLSLAIGNHDLFRRVGEVDPEALLPLMTTRFGQTQRAASSHLSGLLSLGMTSQGGDGSVREEDPDVMAMTCVLLCQSFVFSAPALDANPFGPEIRDQLSLVLDAYLTPLSGPTQLPGPTPTPRPGPTPDPISNHDTRPTHDSRPTQREESS